MERSPEQYCLNKFKEFISHYRPILEKYNAWDMTIINGFDEIMHQDPPIVAERLKEANKICSWIKRDYAGIKISNVGRKMEISTKLMDVWFMGEMPESGCRSHEKPKVNPKAKTTKSNNLL